MEEQRFFGEFAVGQNEGL